MPSFLDTNDLRKGSKILIDGSPYNVLEASFVKPGKGAAFTRTRMKNMLTGGVIERNLRSGEKLEVADIEERTMSYLYKEAEDFVFMDQENYEQLNILGTLIDDDWRWLKDNMACQVLFYNGRAIGVTATVAFEHKPRGVSSATLRYEAGLSRKIVACAEKSVRALTWPPSQRRDTFTTVF